MQRIVVIGATSGIAEHCCRLWAARADNDLTLVGRSASRLEIMAADLRVRRAATVVRTRVADLVDPRAIAACVAAIAAEGPIDLVLIAHGSLPDQLASQADVVAAADVIALNGVSPMLFAEAFVTTMLARGRGTVGVIGSVAGDRGRKSNYVYGAAKGLVTRYAQGLQHRLAGSPVRVVLIKPGPTDTPMTAALKAKGAKLADPAAVAAGIVAAIDAGKPVVYLPGKWAVIMMVIRHLPRFVFDKMDI